MDDNNALKNPLPKIVNVMVPVSGVQALGLGPCGHIGKLY